MEMRLTRGARIIYQVIRLCQYKYQYNVCAGAAVWWYSCDSLHWSHNSPTQCAKWEERRFQCICQRRVPFFLSVWMHIWWLRMCFDWCLIVRNLVLWPMFISMPSIKCLLNGKIYMFALQRRCSWVRRKTIVIFISANCLVNRPGCKTVGWM